MHIQIYGSFGFCRFSSHIYGSPNIQSTKLKQVDQQSLYSSSKLASSTSSPFQWMGHYGTGWEGSIAVGSDVHTSKYSAVVFFCMHGKLQLTAGQLSQQNSPTNADLLLTVTSFTCAFNVLFSPSGAHTDPRVEFLIYTETSESFAHSLQCPDM